MLLRSVWILEHVNHLGNLGESRVTVRILATNDYKTLREHSQCAHTFMQIAWAAAGPSSNVEGY